MNEIIQERKGMDSIQALRAWAFLGVFLSHTLIECFHGMGAWGVSVFFILSGFLMTYNYYGRNRIASVSFLKNIQFAWNKIRPLYPLHIVTMLAMLVFMFVGEDVVQVLQVVVRIFLNMLLVQCWIPMADSSINGVSWYLCATMFSYFLFPYILKYMEKDYSVKKAKKAFFFLFFIQVLVGFIGSFMPVFRYAESDWLEQDLTYWFVYYYPPIRALDFAIGCNLGYCFIANETVERENCKNNTILFELLTIALIVVANICFIVLLPKTKYGVKPLVNAHPERWWTYTVIFTISSCMIIWLFAKNKAGGGIFGHLINRVTLYIGNISSFSFLIHTVVFRYIDGACNLMFGSKFRYFYGKWFKLSLGFILTVVATQMWMWLIHKKVKF